MNTIKALNCLTLVLIFMTGATGWGCPSLNQTYEMCVANITKNAKAPCVGKTGDDLLKCLQTVALLPTDDSTCLDCKKQSDLDSIKNDCRSAYQAYQSANDKTGQECAKYGQPSVGACVGAASACGAYVNGGSQNDPVAALQGLVGAYASMQNAGSPGNGCFIDDDGSEESRKANIDRQVQSLKEQNADSVSSQAQLDDDLAKKKDEIDQKIQELDDEVNKKKVERQTKIQEETSRIQKAELKSQTKKFQNLTKINKLNTDIANLQFAQQQINIDFADARITKSCDDKVEAMKAQLTGQAPAPGTSAANFKPSTKKFTIKEMQKIKSDLQLEQSSCMQTEVLKRSAQMKGLLDKRVALQAEVDTLTKSNEDEDKAILIEKQGLDQLKASMSQEEQNDIDNKFKKQNILATSVTKFAETVDKKKKTIDSKIAARNEQIQNLLLSKQNVKKKYSTISASLGSRQQAQDTYLNQCCTGLDRKSQDKNCGMVQSDSNSNHYDAPGNPGGTNL